MRTATTPGTRRATAIAGLTTLMISGRLKRRLSAGVAVALVAGLLVAAPETQGRPSPASAAAAATVPDPDVLSVDFDKTGPVEHVKGRAKNTSGTPATVFDSTLNRYVGKFNPRRNGESGVDGAGASASNQGYIYNIDDAWEDSSDDSQLEPNPLLTNGGTFECYFRYLGPNRSFPNSNEVCSGKGTGPSAGYAFYLPATGSALRFAANSTTMATTSPTSVVPGEWYHAVATVGNGYVRLYLNGVAASELPTGPGWAQNTGFALANSDIQVPVAQQRFWGIGADPSSMTTIENPGEVEVAASRIWSTPFTPRQVAALWEQERPRTVAGADVLDVDFAADNPVDHVSGRQPTVVGPTPRVDIGFEGKHGATFAGANAYLYQITDAWKPESARNITASWTVECEFFMKTLPAATDNLCTSQANAGISVRATSAGKVQVVARTNAGLDEMPAYRDVLAESKQNFRLNEWTDVIATWDGAKIALYLNGVRQDLRCPPNGNGVINCSGPSSAPAVNPRIFNETTALTNMVAPGVATFAIGGTPTSAAEADGFVHAKVSRVRIWSKALTSIQAESLHWDVRSEIRTPAADVLDVDFSGADRPFADRSGNDRTPTVAGSANVTQNHAFAKQPHYTYNTNGTTDHVLYPLDDVWTDVGGTDVWNVDGRVGVTVQCDVRINTSLPASGHFCSGQSDGGFGLSVDGRVIKAAFYINGGYKTVSSPEIASGRWYSVAATFDGKKIDLYLDGIKVATNSTDTAGSIVAPTARGSSQPPRRQFALGADVAADGTAESPIKVSIGSARMWSSELAPAQIALLDSQSFGAREIDIHLKSSVPGVDGRLDKPTVFDVDVVGQDLATGWTYLLQGQEIQPGDIIGAGLTAGSHKVQVSATDVFGRHVSFSIPFTAVNMIGVDGTKTSQSGGLTELSAVARAGDGGNVTTTFQQATLATAEGRFQGTVAKLPNELGLNFDDVVAARSPITGALSPGDGVTVDTPADHSRYPFQRIDVTVDNWQTGQLAVWTGTVDPARQASLWAWDTVNLRWFRLAQSRGVAGVDTTLQGNVRSTMVDDGTDDGVLNGVAHLLVIATDPFADDLSPHKSDDPNDGSATGGKDQFADTSNVDFSFVHYTDPQYITEGATGSQFRLPGSPSVDNIDGKSKATGNTVQWNSADEAAVWEASLRAQTEWIKQNGAQHKVAWVGNSGDMINSDIPNNALNFDSSKVTDTDSDGNLYNETISETTVHGTTGGAGNVLTRGPKDQVRTEYTLIKDIHGHLATTGIPNQTVAGNHDNANGAHNGWNSPFAQFFPASFYQQQQAGTTGITGSVPWPAGAQYHAWDEVLDSNGKLVTPGKDNSNNYVLFSAGGLDFVAVGLSYSVTQEEADWASSIFRRYPDRNGILMTHGYLSASSKSDGRDAPFGSDGSRLYQQVVTPNPNIFLVLGGHFHGVGTNLETITGPEINHKVVSMLADYQGYMVQVGEIFTAERCARAGEITGRNFTGKCLLGTGADAGKIDVDGDGDWDHNTTDLLPLGASFLRLLQFNTSANTMTVDTYSPFLDEFGATRYDRGSDPFNNPVPSRYNTSADNFTVPINLSTRTTSFKTDGLLLVTPTDTVIGRATTKSGEAATVTWSGLTKGKTYGWFATSVNADDATLGEVRQFGGSFVATQEGADTTAPTVTVKPESKGKDGVYSEVSYKLFDQGKIDKAVLNGVEKDLVNDVWSDLNSITPGRFGAVEGSNTLQVYDVAGNVTTVSFTLDTQGPGVSFVSPSDGATVSGTVPVTVALSGQNLQAYNLRIDSAGLQYAWLPTEGQVTFYLDTTTLSDGVHTLLATATDMAENKTTVTMKITVDNAPKAPYTTTTVTILSGKPAKVQVDVVATPSTQTVKGTVKVSFYYPDGRKKTDKSASLKNGSVQINLPSGFKPGVYTVVAEYKPDAGGGPASISQPILWTVG
ncbi:LamG-like jellyroll fold domain-containing protein [Dactylosporangium sp. NPDC050688]|uniref:LamG-like jellyroll fold domain-containing protein n=1 Tax=Dactylosporangium sp. NPDC050688 TaxID=3157217 RepID=UPI0033C90294